MMLPGIQEARELRRPTPRKIDTFVGRLASAIPSVTVRWSQGSDVGGGCGQLRGRKES
jgi:adenine C2-methylase RlmN of 23S rRNA A2503 and tRNA A37